ncbi:hypothetical protein OIU77_006810 [Salix suchowensis]|uniref:Ethylene receptor 1-like N-terminal domain-containing protein n=1 Tax=Salix suchowensis TaxID=1278906 RepID=A0ABQ9AMY0_9ROSI|nr:hypothetical protein OIU77_006810 [Salix suchowensis]
MLRALASRFLLISYLAILVTASDNDFGNCNCDDEGLRSIHNIMEARRVSDFLIAIAYFSIPIELLWFISCSNFPFKWVLLQFIAFIVLCGLTHLLNAWTYYGPHSIRMPMLQVSNFKGGTPELVDTCYAILVLVLPSMSYRGWSHEEMEIVEVVADRVGCGFVSCIGS